MVNKILPKIRIIMKIEMAIKNIFLAEKSDYDSFAYSIRDNYLSSSNPYLSTICSSYS